MSTLQTLMRRSLRAIHRSPIGYASTNLSLTPFPAFSTASGGRGRGRGVGSPFSDTSPAGKPAIEDDLPANEPGLGHGRGTPIPPLHTTSPLAAAGRGRAPASQPGAEAGPKLPIFFTKNDPDPSSVDLGQGRGRTADVAAKNELHLGIVSALSGAGRGKIAKEAVPVDQPKEEVKIENRHLRAKQAVKSDKDDDFGAGLYLGDEKDGEKLAKKLGPEKMDMLVEAFEEMSSRVLPSPAEDAYIDALHTNMMIECEPEYMMEEFGTNPDIDDTPPIPLRDALEKMKPFLMAYENITSHEEWEKIIEETMKTVPLMKEIVDHYCGPDRVTAKQQQKELRRVADTLPDRAHASVKRFTDRAILSLQSNPGWGFDKKCQFMDKLVWEVSQHYK